MTLQNIKTILKELNIPVAYSHFATKTKPPYIVYLIDGTNNFFADNLTYYENEYINVELYTEKKDIQLENKLKTIFKENEIAYEIISDIFIQSENLFQIIFSISI